jgi:putative tryptophan/tyrosine transport system substrate-binding protein
MRRRDFITLLGSSATVWSLAAGAQESGRIYRLAFVIPSPRQAPPTIALFDELRRSGFSEGQNLAVIPDGFEADYEHVAELAAALVKAAPDAIIAGPAVALRALQDLTHTIPLIGMSEDMVAEGVVASLTRPGGNTTGISLLSPELDGKRQDILIEAVPGARRIGAMADANAAPPYHLQALEHAARSRGVELSIFRVSGPEEIITSIDAVEALNFLATPLFAVPGSQNNRIVLDRVAAVRLPAILQFPEDAEAGALAGYGPRITDLDRQRARITVQVLRGAKPADIPVQQPDRFELVINLKAAKAIGVEVPATLVARADKLIDERT